MIILPGDLKKLPNRQLPNVVTSFNEEGYKRYGEAFIETFLKYWSPGVRLTVFYEGDNFPFTHGLSWVPIEKVALLADYLGNLRFPIMHGIVGNHYNIQFDARQARKVFIEMHALKMYGGKVFWIDADTITHSHVPETFLDDVLPDGDFCCFLGRDGWFYTETGFIGYNANHPIASKFIKNYLNLYVTGVNFTMPGWHDCYGFDAIRRQVFGDTNEFINLAEGLPHGTMHPFVNSICGKYMDHRKGKRKDSRSTSADLVVKRTEEYWATPQDSTAPA